MDVFDRRIRFGLRVCFAPVAVGLIVLTIVGELSWWGLLIALACLWWGPTVLFYFGGWVYDLAERRHPDEKQ
jgi:hypothetical protein